MKIKAKRSIIVLFTLIFAVSVFAVTAFATETNSASLPSSSNSESAPDSGTGGNVTPTSDAPATSGPVSSTDSTGGAGSSGADSTGSTPSGTESSIASSSSTVTASSHTESAASSRYVSSNKPTQSVDTQNSRVEAIASQAEAAVSDPDALSSQDWSELLSSTAESAVQAGGTVSSIESSLSSAPTGQGGGISWLLILGIVFILLGVGGIGFFVYQFVSNRRGGPGGYAGPIDISSRSSKNSDPIDDTQPMEFEDISSDSDGTQHRSDDIADSRKSFDNIRPAGTVNRTPSTPPAAEKPKTGKAEVSAKDVTAPIPQEDLPQRSPEVPPQDTGARPISQATPIQNGKNFDWEKFFNEDDE